MRLLFLLLDATELLGFIPIVIIVISVLEWIIGMLIGKNLSRNTGIIVGVIFIFIGWTFFFGLACIIYSQKNKNAPIDINANINTNINKQPLDIMEKQSTSDTMECPYCAEIIKKNAKICRYCNHTLKEND